MFESLINELCDAGLTEAAIAKRAGTTQPSINRIRRGKQKPKYDIADALRALHAELGLSNTHVSASAEAETAQAEGSAPDSGPLPEVAAA